jgi:hypothetical protein
MRWYACSCHNLTVPTIDILIGSMHLPQPARIRVSSEMSRIQTPYFGKLSFYLKNKEAHHESSTVLDCRYPKPQKSASQSPHPRNAYAKKSSAFSRSLRAATAKTMRRKLASRNVAVKSRLTRIAVFQLTLSKPVRRKQSPYQSLYLHQYLHPRPKPVSARMSSAFCLFLRAATVATTQRKPASRSAVVKSQPIRIAVSMSNHVLRSQRQRQNRQLVSATPLLVEKTTLVVASASTTQKKRVPISVAVLHHLPSTALPSALKLVPPNQSPYQNHFQRLRLKLASVQPSFVPRSGPSLVGAPTMER